MLNKYASETESAFYAPSISDLSHAQKNSKSIANLILAALGVSAAGYSAKRLMEALSSSRMSSSIQPVTKLQKRIRESASGIDNEFLYSDKKLQHPFDEEYAAELERLKKEEKKGSYKQALFDFPLYSDDVNKDRTWSEFFTQGLTNKHQTSFSDKLSPLDVNKVLSNKEDGLKDLLHYDPKTLKTDSKWTKHITAPLAKLGPQSAIPLALALGGGLMAAPITAKALVGIAHKILPKTNRRADFVDDAKKIYEDAARELHEVGYKKEKDEKRKKEGAYKFAGKDKKVKIDISNNAGNPLTSVSNLPTLLLAAALGYTAYKGVKGFGKGVDKAKHDLSHQTQLLRGWTATNKLRNYNYNPMTAELAEEPGLKTRTMREKNERIRDLLEDLRDSEDIHVNPLEIQRLTGDYAELA